MGCRTVPEVGVEGTGYIDAASRADLIGQLEALGYVMQIVAPLRGIGIEHVAPSPDFGDHYVFGGEGFFDIGGIAVGTVGGCVAQAAMFLRQLARIVGFEKDRASESYGSRRAERKREAQLIRVSGGSCWRSLAIREVAQMRGACGGHGA